MKRRQSLKYLAGTAVGLTGLGYWSMGCKEVDEALATSVFTAEEQDVLTAICDAMIPAGESYGAVQLGVPIFLLGYLDRCENAEVHELIKSQITLLDERSHESSNQEFLDLDPDAQRQMLTSFAESEVQEENRFFDLLKKQIVRGFRTTEEVMTEVYHYRVIPGHYHGCIDINEPSIT